MSDATKVLAETLALDRKDRTEVVLKLLQSLDGGAATDDVEAAWQAEVERRVKDVENGTSESVSLGRPGTLPPPRGRVLGATGGASAAF